MKKLMMIVSLCLGVSMAMAQTNCCENNSYTSDSGAKPTCKTVLNYDKNLIIGYSITFNYPIEEIETAVLARLKSEGIEGSKKKNFYAFKEIKYNKLWNRKFDLYLHFTGSTNAGTINMLLSQGYDNFIIPAADCETTNKALKWLTELDLDVQHYRYNLNMQTHQEEYENIDKALEKLEKKRASIEKKVRKNKDAWKKFEASKTVVKEGDVNVDTKKIEKEQQQAQKLTEEKNELADELAKINKEIDSVKSDLEKKHNVITDYKKEKPRTINDDQK